MNDHYFSSSPLSEHYARNVILHLHDIDAELATDSGVFSPKRIDPGTQRLLEERSLVIPESGDLLDLGCGYGPIAITLARRFPDRRVWAVDVNERACGLTRQNAKSLGLYNIETIKPGDVPADAAIGAIFSNPPIKSGKALLHELLLHWLPRLQPGGYAYLVVHKHLGSDSLMKWLNEQGFVTTRVSSGGGYRILVHCRT